MPAEPSTAKPDERERRARLMQRRRRQRELILGMILASCAVDAFFLAALAALGVVKSVVPVVYGLTYLASFGLVHLLSLRGWMQDTEDHYLLMPQMLLSSAINLAFIVWIPQVGGLLLMAMFVIFGFGALRMTVRRALAGSLFIAASVGMVMALMGERIAMPMLTWQERALSGLWFALVLARCALLGLYGDHMRSLLAKRNTELAETSRQLERLAGRDELTGMLNRRSAMARLQEAHRGMQASGEPFAVALLDMDDFKLVNDGFGHAVGDEVLRRFAGQVAADLREGDRLARYGGEEFLLLLAAPIEAEAAKTVVERVCDSVARHDWSGVSPGLEVTVSAGVAVCRPGEDMPQLLRRADAALYVAKAAGRNCVRAADAAPQVAPAESGRAAVLGPAGA